MCGRVVQSVMRVTAEGGPGLITSTKDEGLLLTSFVSW